jgi:hypothetical protein
MAAFSRYAGALDWARRRAEAVWAPVAIESERFPFNETQYYDASMGPGLEKLFLVFPPPYDPAQAADDKLLTNQWEREYAGQSDHPEPRPLNLDPGYLTRGKLVLTSTKDFAHRIYLRDGIYAEVTLFYRHGRWQHHEFTFADYRQAEYHRFFDRARELIRG